MAYLNKLNAESAATLFWRLQDLEDHLRVTTGGWRKVHAIRQKVADRIIALGRWP